jgi:hypothetical protein
MSIPTELLKYIQNSERLVVISVVVFLSVALAHWGEKHALFEFNGLPEWVRPSSILAGILAGIHVSVRLMMFLWNLCKITAKHIREIPQKRREARGHQPIIDSLIAIEGLPREVLCYARYRNDKYFGVGINPRAEWLQILKHSGLIERSASDCNRYKIYHVAWAYINKYPDRFICKLPWPDPPWTFKLDEQKFEERLQTWKMGKLY